MRYALIDTDLGTFGLAWTEHGVARVALPSADRARTEIWISREPAEPGFPDKALSALPEMIRRYAAGELVDFSAVPVDLSEVPEFNRRVYAEALKLGYGETTTYGAIART